MAARVAAINVTRGVTLASRARVADTLLTRVVGLLRDRGLADGDGLWIVPCNSIHSIAMKFDFDAVFLDRDLRVVHLMLGHEALAHLADQVGRENRARTSRRNHRPHRHATSATSSRCPL